MFIHSKRIYTSDGVKDAIMKVEDGKIVEFLNPNAKVMIDLEYDDLRIIPGIFDTHNHGTMGYTLMGNFPDKENQVRGYLKGLASQGVTICLPTPDLHFIKPVAKVAKEKIKGAKVIGIHSEGPYLNRTGENGIKEEPLKIERETLEKMVSDSDGLLKLVAIAPELEGAKEAIEYFNSLGIKVAFAHSDMNYNEAMEAFKWGIQVTTHTANVMSGIHHRHMGGLGACLLNDDVYNELICDGLHVANEMIEIILRVKKDALNKVMMVSDTIAMAGAAEGFYKIPGMLSVIVDKQGFCKTETGRLYGSTIPVIKGIKNLVTNLKMDLEDVIKMASYNPCQVYDVKTKGSLSVGKDADFVIIDEDFNVLKTYLEGECIYDQAVDQNLFSPDLLKMVEFTPIHE